MCFDAGRGGGSGKRKTSAMLGAQCSADILAPTAKIAAGVRSIRGARHGIFRNSCISRGHVGRYVPCLMRMRGGGARSAGRASDGWAGQVKGRTMPGHPRLTIYGVALLTIIASSSKASGQVVHDFGEVQSRLQRG